MVSSFDSVSFSSYFKSIISHLRDEEAGTLTLGFQCYLAMISLRAVNFSSLSFLGFSSDIVENCFCVMR